jgi:hypothetical protein
MQYIGTHFWRLGYFDAVYLNGVQRTTPLLTPFYVPLPSGPGTQVTLREMRRQRRRRRERAALAAGVL